jgi:hypothetical protein
VSGRKVKLTLTVPQALAVLSAINERLAGEFETVQGRMLNHVRDTIIDQLPEES